MKRSQLTSFLRLIKTIHTKFTSGRSHEVGLFLVFVCIASCYWLILTLNNETQEVVDIPFSIVDIPDSVTILSDIPKTIKVNVHDKGSSLLRSRISGQRSLKVDWMDYATSDNTIRMSKVDILGQLRTFFAPSAQITNVMPDSLRLAYTTMPGIKLPVCIETDLSPELGFTINGPVVMTPDSITLYALDDIPDNITCVSATPTIRKGLRDTTHISIRITPPDGSKAIPDHITLSIPVEPLIMKQQKVRIETCNVPDGHGLLTFPAVIDISYLIPMSAYKTDSHILKATVEYSDAVASTNGYIPVRIPYVPGIYRDLSLSQDSVEYILETKH
ncbi:MAG: hypothetical protein K2M98_07145 [Muribaculum sp.]|nr:hypothetical protein [Muribaculum sp.]